jgi:hypothetical protein
MVWQNPKIRLCHGTNTHVLPHAALTLYQVLSAFRLNVLHSNRPVDFGRGFYTTTILHQAREWANDGVRRLSRLAQPIACNAVVVQFSIDRDALAGLETMTFVAPTDDYFDFVASCRSGFAPHQRAGALATKRHYDVVYGPVALGLQKLVLHNCDQVSFHDQTSAARLLRSPIVYELATASTGLLP